MSPKANAMHPEDKPEPWKPAAERVAADEWRRMKQEFFDEAARRTTARNAQKN